MPSLRRLTLGLLLALSAVGCGGGSDLPELGMVAGVLTDGGKPVAGATVEFYPEKGNPSFATTGTDGRFEMTYGAGLPGAVLGKHHVRVTVPDPKREKAAEASAEEPAIPAAKSLAMPSPVEVKAGGNTIELDLARAR